jgi:hypothetical protein
MPMGKVFTEQRLVATDLQYNKFNRNSFSTIEHKHAVNRTSPVCISCKHTVRKMNDDDDYGLTIATTIIIFSITTMIK